MIRFLQTQGPAKKIILSGILLVICAAMVIAFIPGGLGSDLLGAPGKGVVAKVDGGDVTVDKVREAHQHVDAPPVLRTAGCRPVDHPSGAGLRSRAFGTSRYAAGSAG